jgi:hypothetical protein
MSHGIEIPLEKFIFETLSSNPLEKFNPRELGNFVFGADISRVASHLFTGGFAGIGKLPALFGWYIRYGIWY